MHRQTHCTTLPNCSCSRRRRRTVAYMLARAFSVVIVLVLIGMLMSFLIRQVQPHDTTAQIASLRRELEALKRACKPDNDRTAKRYSPALENTAQQACSVESSPCELQEREIRDAIRKELSLYHADKTGMPDFAMENIGGCVLTTRDTKTMVQRTSMFSKGESDPNEILRPDVTPGKCWAFEGTSGTAVIKLMSFVFISHVTLEHISPKMTPTGDIASAPKTFTLWGLNDPEDPFGKHKFGTFEYKRGDLPVQTFPVKHPVRRSFRVVEITFHDNHGNDQYTCVYRVRIHGKMDGDGRQPSGNTPS